jgi:hypothetical protein
MADCPNCEYHRQRAQRWRDEAYKQAGHPLPEREQEPVAFINVEQRKLEWAKYMSWDTPTVVNLPKIPLYTTPPQRTWVGLTDDEIAKIEDEYIVDYRIPAGSAWNFAKDIEAKLKEKNEQIKNT